MTILRAARLSAGYGAVPAIEAVDLAVAGGEYVGIVGPNGSGKTTLLRALLGLLPAQAGGVELWGVPLADFRGWRKIGYLPQSTSLPFRRFPADVREVVASGRLAHLRFPKRLAAADHAAVDRALAAEPELLILDEPTSALDPAFREQFYALLARLNRERKTTLLLVTHDSASIGAHATRLVYIDQRIVFDGTFDEFCHSPRMTDYFGPAVQHQLCGRHLHAPAREAAP